MRSVLAIAKKELSIYFTTPIAYVFFMVVAFVSALFFTALINIYRMQTISAMQNRNPGMLERLNLTDFVVAQLLGTMGLILVLAIPFVAMGLLADEKKMRTFELLMTSPVKPFQIVLGKYLASLVVLLAALALVFIFPIILAVFGENSAGTGPALEWPTVLTGMLGLFLLGAMSMAVVLFFSSVTNTSIVAALVSFIVLLVLWVGGALGWGSEGVMRDVISSLSMSDHINSFLSGRLVLRDILYFLSFVVLGLYLTDRAIEGHRWA